MFKNELNTRKKIHTLKTLQYERNMSYEDYEVTF
jgi:hypothetical protein